MSSYRTELGQVIFDPATRSYKATVTFHEGTDRRAFDCSLRFPIDMPMEEVAAALVRQAKEMRQHSALPLRSLIEDTTKVVPFASQRRKPAVPALRHSA